MFLKESHMCGFSMPTRCFINCSRLRVPHEFCARVGELMSKVVGVPLRLAEVAARLQRGDLSPVTGVEVACDRLDLYEARVRAFLPEPNRRSRVISEARVLADRSPDPSKRAPLFGVLVGMKDIYSVDGLPTRAGTHANKHTHKHKHKHINIHTRKHKTVTNIHTHTRTHTQT